MSNQNSILKLNNDQIKRLLEDKHTSIQQITLVLKNVENIELKHIAALRLHEIGDPSVLPNLIEEINKENNKNYRGTLVYSCEAFDCSQYLEFFIDLIINDSTEVAMTSVLIIEGMNDLSKERINAQIDKLRHVMKNQKENHNMEFIEESFQILKRMTNHPQSH